MAFALLVGVASQANADIWGHVDNQANAIERAAKTLRTEVDHYRHTRYYGQLIGATARLKGQAVHVHNIAHHSHCPIALKAAVKELDRAFHDAENLFDRVEHEASYGEGRIRGNTAHVKRLLNAIDGAIHHLRSDLAALNRSRNRTRVDVYRPPVNRQAYPVNRGYRGSGKGGNGYGYSRPVYSSQRRGNHRSAYGGSGFGLSIGGGSSRITFNF